jgi:hypothetical protein
MTSRREAILREVLARCRAAVTPVAVIRDPGIALTRDQVPALVLTIEADAPLGRHNDRIERALAVRLTALVRSPGDGHAEADALICAAHAALFTDVSLGGLALDITELEADYQIEDADLDAIAIPALYRITYRTLVSDLRQGG